jgi:hypothetical protein
MQLQHHSTVELIDRLVEGDTCCIASNRRRRQVLVKLTHDGEVSAKLLALHHLHELQSVGPTFVKVLQSSSKIKITSRPNGA